MADKQLMGNGTRVRAADGALGTVIDWHKTSSAHDFVVVSWDGAAGAGTGGACDMRAANLEIVAAQAECTEEQGATWRERHSDGYQAGRGDARRGHGNRFELIEVPAELPGENGAQYVARHVGIAWSIGYAEAWAYETSR